MSIKELQDKNTASFKCSVIIINIIMVIIMVIIIVIITTVRGDVLMNSQKDSPVNSDNEGWYCKAHGGPNHHIIGIINGIDSFSCSFSGCFSDSSSLLLIFTSIALNIGIKLIRVLYF